MSDLNKFKGCLIGGAVGDALGYAVEFMRADDIFQKYGKDGITEYELRHGVAEISDDTQMTLFTAAGLLGATAGKGDYVGHIVASYKDWYRTQREPYPISGERSSWLVNVPELFNRRAPGNTCMTAMSRGGLGTLENHVNDSKGCGGVMRVAPIGLYFANGNFTSMQQTDIDLIGAKAAAITHGHELGYIPAAALVHIISLLAKQDKISVLDAVADSVVSMRKIFKESEHIRQFHTLMEKAADLAVSSYNDIDAIRQLGEGWVAEETLAIAVYCVLKYPDNFEKAIIAAVNHDGDSDSTGAIAGNILGVALGLDAIPQKYLDNLELKDVIIEIAEDLYSDSNISERDEIWESKYITVTYGKKA